MRPVKEDFMFSKNGSHKSRLSNEDFLKIYFSLFIQFFVIVLFDKSIFNVGGKFGTKNVESFERLNKMPVARRMMV